MFFIYAKIKNLIIFIAKLKFIFSIAWQKLWPDIHYWDFSESY